jgi:YHS domain-containing protein
VLRVLLLGVLVLMVARAFWRIMDGIIEAGGGLPRDRRRVQPPAARLVRDPVCGTHVATASALTARDGGRTHYFCSEQCRRAFLTQGAQVEQHR